jgi:hypothetical protein
MQPPLSPPRRACVAVLLAASLIAPDARAQRGNAPEPYRPGISVLLDDQVSLVRGRRIGLITANGAEDERGRRVETLLRDDRRARVARVTVAAVWRLEDWIPGGAWDVGSGTGADSVRLAAMIAGVDSVIHLSQVLVVDVPDPGMRTAAAPYVLLAALRAAGRARVPVIVLDRANPLGGDRVEGPTPVQDAAPSDALYGLPTRHGMTAGELAPWFNERAGIGAAVEVVPVRGWRRAGEAARDRDLVGGVAGERIARDQLALLAAFAPVSASGLRVLPGPGRSEVRIAATGLDAAAIANAVADRLIPGTRVSASRADVEGRATPVVVIERRDPDSPPALRTVLAVLSEVRRRAPGLLAIRAAEFDRLACGAALREALERDDDPDATVDRLLAPAMEFRTATQRYRRYR